MQDGKQILVFNKVISRDGQTMTQTLKNVDKDGKPQVIIRVYEKQ